MHSLEFENGTARILHAAGLAQSRGCTIPIYLASRPKALAQVTTSEPDYGTSTGKAPRTGKAIDKDNAKFRARQRKYSASSIVRRLKAAAK